MNFYIFQIEESNSQCIGVKLESGLNYFSYQILHLKYTSHKIKFYNGQQFLDFIQQIRKNHIILVLDDNVRFSINKYDKNNKNGIFLFNMRGLGPQIQLKIDNQRDLQYCIKYIGAYGYGYGLQSITSQFQKAGKGNFATVYKFVSTFKTTKAMKMFEKKKLENQKNKHSFLNQINIMKSLKSPYIVNLDCIFQTQKNYYLQMQYFEETLKSFLKNQITRKKQKLIMRNLLDGLKQLKSNNVVHRDIKPDNIMVRKNGNQDQEFVLIDLGLSARQTDIELLHKKCGTPGFIAPQIANMTDKIPINFQCDIFSLGVTFFYILTKKKPFSALDNKQMLLKNKKLIIEEHLFYYVSQTEADLVKKMMQKDPQKRITVEDALNHSYFDEEIDDDDLIAEENCDLDSKLKQIQIMDTSFMSQGIVLLYSLFAFSYKLPQTKSYFTECYGETEFHEIQSNQQSIQTQIKDIIQNKKRQRKLSKFSQQDFKSQQVD